MYQKTAHLKWQYTQIEQQIKHNPYKILPGFFTETDNTFIRVITILKNNKVERFKLLILHITKLQYLRKCGTAIKINLSVE